MPSTSTLLLILAAVTLPLLWGVVVDLVFERIRSRRAERNASRGGNREQDGTGERADDWVI